MIRVGSEPRGVEPSMQELYEDAPCGYLSMLPDGTIAKANRTFLRSLGHTADAVVGRRLEELLAPGSRLYYATHWRPKLDLAGAVSEIPADLVRADGGRLSVLINATLVVDGSGAPTAIRASLFDATDRRRYERELVAARDVEHAARERAELLQRLSAALSDAAEPADVARVLLEELVEQLGADAGELEVDGSTLATATGRRRLGPHAAARTLTVPLAAGGRGLGCLRLRVRAQQAPTTEQRSLLDACAAQGAQALVRAQLYAEVRGRSEQQAAVARFGTRALEDLELAQLVDEAAAVVHRVLRADRVTISREDATAGADCGEALPGATAALAVDIRTGAGAFGRLEVHAARERRFGAGDEDFAAGMAHVLGNAAERRHQEATAAHRATHDPLTGLPNRLLLVDRLAHEVARADRNGTTFALCLLDLDDFKLVNDTLGHQLGDELLRAVADRLVAAMRDSDMVVRLGGDEFAILGADLHDALEAETLAERAAAALTAPFAHRGSEHVVRVSIGVALGDATSTPEAVLRDADVAMYRAKEGGRARHTIFDQSMREQLDRRLQTETELRVALRDGDLRVFYQPVVDAGTRRLQGLEALVRWQHPERGLVPPDAFIPVAEATGLVVELGRQVMREACRQLVAWRAAGVVADHVAVAVNVSGRQLTQAGFVDEVAALLAETGLDATPHLLGLEITESVLMEAADQPTEVLDRLAGLGVRLLLDDFGTGASSLARLKRFPVDTLKIDRGFVRGTGAGSIEDDAIVAAVVAMAKALSLRVIAEGVETDAQLEFLRGVGCERIQGFLFSPPVPADALRAALLEAPAGELPTRS